MTEEIEIIIYNKIDDFKDVLDKLIKDNDKYNENIANIINIFNLLPKIDAGLILQLRREIKGRTGIIFKEIDEIIKQRKVEIKKEIKEAQAQAELNLLPISQIERTIAKLITDKFTIITFEETDEICLYQNSVFLRNRISRAKIRKEIFDIVSEKYPEYQENLSKRAMIIEIIKNMTFYPMEKFGLKAEIINLRNGIIKYENNKLKFIPHSILKKRNMILYTFIQFPIYFDKNAKCPTISKILEDIFGLDQYIDVIEFVSYVLFPTLKFDKGLILQGPRDTGETTFLNMLKQFLGRKNYSQLELYKLAKQFQVENVRFKAANICDDLAPLPFRYSACSWIKKLITNSYLAGEMKGIQGNKDWINVCKLICACNILPEPDDKTDAWWKRWIGISCVNQFIGKNKDTRLKDLKWSQEEMSGLLNKCLIAWLRLNRRGGFREKWNNPDFVRLWWMSNIDPVFEFVDKYCMVGNAGDEIDYEEFISKFNTSRKERGLKILSKSLITRGLIQVNENIKKKKINIHSNPESSGHSYTYIRWAEIVDPQYVEFLNKPNVNKKIEKWKALKIEDDKKKRAFAHLEDGQEVDYADVF